MITLMWTKSHLPLSKTIRYLLDIPTSHFSIAFDKKVVFHSNLKGVHLVSYDKFIKKNHIVFEKNYDLGLEKEEEIWQKILIDEGKWYDFLAFLYFAKAAIAYKFFKIPISRKNKLNSKGLLCTELAHTLPKNLFKHEIKDLSMIDPYRLYNSIRDT